MPVVGSQMIGRDDLLKRPSIPSRPRNSSCPRMTVLLGIRLSSPRLEWSKEWQSPLDRARDINKGPGDQVVDAHSAHKHHSLTDRYTSRYLRVQVRSSLPTVPYPASSPTPPDQAVN